MEIPTAAGLLPHLQHRRRLVHLGVHELQSRHGAIEAEVRIVDHFVRPERGRCQPTQLRHIESRGRLASGLTAIRGTIGWRLAGKGSHVLDLSL